MTGYHGVVVSLPTRQNVGGYPGEYLKYSACFEMI